MRRQWVRSWQRKAFRIGASASRQAAFQRQEALARKYGLKIVNLCVNLFIASVLVTLVYLWAIHQYESGLLKGPDRD